MNREIHLHFHFYDEGAAAVMGRLGAIDDKISALVTQGVSIMSTLQDIQGNEAHEGTALGQLADAVTALKAGQAALQQQLADALSGTTLPPAVQTAVDAAFAASKANSDNVDAILASLAPVTPPAPPPIQPV